MSEKPSERYSEKMSEDTLGKKRIIIGEKYCPLLSNSLKRLGYDIIPLPDNPFVDTRLSGHADLSVFYCGGNTVFAAPYLKNTEFAEKIQNLDYNFRICDIKQGAKYPNDVQMNLCSCGNSYIYMPGSSCTEITEILNEEGREGIPCRQGYCNCSICTVNESSVITADRGISAILSARGFDVLEISPGYISLEGFDYGFIGGASFMLDDKTLAFTGSLEHHPQFNEIESFIKSKKVRPIFLSNFPAFDIGSAIII